MNNNNYKTCEHCGRPKVSRGFERTSSGLFEIWMCLFCNKEVKVKVNGR